MKMLLKGVSAAILSSVFLSFLGCSSSSSFVNAEAYRYQNHGIDWSVTLTSASSDVCKVYQINEDLAAVLISSSNSTSSRKLFSASDLEKAVIFNTEQRSVLLGNIERALEVVSSDETAFFDFTMTEEDFFSKMEYNKTLAELSEKKDGAKVKSLRLQCTVEDASALKKKKTILISINDTEKKLTQEQLVALQTALTF